MFFLPARSGKRYKETYQAFNVYLKIKLLIATYFPYERENIRTHNLKPWTVPLLWELRRAVAVCKKKKALVTSKANARSSSALEHRAELAMSLWPPSILCRSLWAIGKLKNLPAEMACLSPPAVSLRPVDDGAAPPGLHGQTSWQEQLATQSDRVGCWRTLRW